MVKYKRCWFRSILLLIIITQYIQFHKVFSEKPPSVKETILSNVFWLSGGLLGEPSNQKLDDNIYAEYREPFGANGEYEMYSNDGNYFIPKNDNYQDNYQYMNPKNNDIFPSRTDDDPSRATKTDDPLKSNKYMNPDLEEEKKVKPGLNHEELKKELEKAKGIVEKVSTISSDIKNALDEANNQTAKEVTKLIEGKDALLNACTKTSKDLIAKQRDSCVGLTNEKIQKLEKNVAYQKQRVKVLESQLSRILKDVSSFGEDDLIQYANKLTSINEYLNANEIRTIANLSDDISQLKLEVANNEFILEGLQNQYKELKSLTSNLDNEVRLSIDSKEKNLKAAEETRKQSNKMQKDMLHKRIRDDVMEQANLKIKNIAKEYDKKNKILLKLAAQEIVKCKKKVSKERKIKKVQVVDYNSMDLQNLILKTAKNISDNITKTCDIGKRCCCEESKNKKPTKETVDKPHRPQPPHHKGRKIIRIIKRCDPIRKWQKPIKSHKPKNTTVLCKVKKPKPTKEKYVRPPITGEQLDKLISILPKCPVKCPIKKCNCDKNKTPGGDDGNDGGNEDENDDNDEDDEAGDPPVSVDEKCTPVYPPGHDGNPDEALYPLPCINSENKDAPGHNDLN